MLFYTVAHRYNEFGVPLYFTQPPRVNVFFISQPTPRGVAYHPINHLSSVVILLQSGYVTRWVARKKGGVAGGGRKNTTIR